MLRPATLGLLVCAAVSAGAASSLERPAGQSLHDRLHPGEGVVETARRRGLLKVGVGLFAPWVMCDAEGKRLIGYEVDVARELAADMGVRLQFVRTDWYFIVPALIEREYDLIVSGMGITPERGLHVNFADPSAEFGTAVVAHTGQTAGRSAPADFDSPNVVFGARSGTVPAQTVAEHFPRAVLRLFDTDTALLAALVAGEVHAAAADQVKAASWLNAHAATLHRPFEVLFNPVPEAIALRKGDADGVNFLNGWIAHHRAAGWLAERRRYWFDTREWADLAASTPEALAKCEASFEPNPY